MFKIRKIVCAIFAMLMLAVIPLTQPNQVAEAQGTTKPEYPIQFSESIEEPVFEGKTWYSRRINEPKKQWSITFNQPIDPSTVTISNIFIADEEDNKFPIRIAKFIVSLNTVVVEPIIEYEISKTYYLYILKGLKSQNGKSLYESMRVPFVYMSEPKKFSTKLTYEAKENVVTPYFPRWRSTITSYLVDNRDNTISVIEANETITVETYDDRFNLTANKSINYELPLFGGFLSGEKYNYIAFGQINREEDDDKEVIRIVRYDKNFKRIDSVSIKGGESFTVIPFDAGSGRMAEHKNTLVFHTSRERYTTEDGLNHQSQLTIIVDTSTMTVVNDMGRYQINHVSHSFDQYVLFDNDVHVLVDHGDAYPRSIVLTRQNGEYYSMVDLFHIPGEIGANCTGVSIGGFEISSENYLVAMNTIDHSLVSEYTSNGMVGLGKDQRDIVLCSLPRDSIYAASVKQVTLAHYVGSKKNGSIPHLVKISDERLMVLWQEFGSDNAIGDLKYVMVDKNGDIESETQTISNFKLSQCKPIVINNKVVWYANENGVRTFYTIPVY